MLQQWVCDLTAVQLDPHWQPSSATSAGAAAREQPQDACPPGFDPVLYQQMRSQIWGYLRAESDSVLTTGTGLVLPRPEPLHLLDLYSAPAVPQVRRCRLGDMHVSWCCACQDKLCTASSASARGPRSLISAHALLRPHELRVQFLQPEPGRSLRICQPSQRAPCDCCSGHEASPNTIHAVPDARRRQRRLTGPRP